MPQIPILGLAADTIDRKAQASRNKKAGADPNKPLAAQPTKGLNTQIDTLDEKTGKRRMPSLGKGLYRHTLELDNGIVYEFDATRKLSEAEQDQELAYYVTTPEYKQKVAQIEGQRAKRANTPASELGPYDNRRVQEIAANKKLDNELILATTRGLGKAGYPVGGLTPQEVNSVITPQQRALTGGSEYQKGLAEFASDTVNQPFLKGIGDAFGEASGITQALKLLGANQQADAVQGFLGSMANPANLTGVAPAMQALANPAKAADENYYNAFDDRLPFEQRIGPAINIALGIYALKGGTFPFKGRNIPVTPELRKVAQTFRGNPSQVSLQEFADKMEAAWRTTPELPMGNPESRLGQKALPGRGPVVEVPPSGTPINPEDLRDLAIVIAGHMARGAKTVASFAEIIKREHPNLYGAFLKDQDAIVNLASRYHNTRLKPSESKKLVDPRQILSNKEGIEPPYTVSTKGILNEKTNQQTIRDVQEGQGIRDQGEQPQRQGNGQKANAKKEVTVEPPPVIKTGETPDSVAPPKQTTTPSAEPQTTGVSNRAQLSDAEKGLLMEDPKGKGRSAEDIYNANRNRTDYQNVAAEVAKGRPFSSDDAAAVIAGNRTLTAKVKDAADELDHAINNKQSQSIIDQRREALRSALEEKQQFVDNIQKGKSQWSDTGRVFGLDTRIDNGDIGQVLGEARRWKGSDLNSKEVAQLTKAVEEHARRVKAVEAELKAAQEKIAEKATQNMRAKAGPKPTPDRIADIRKRRADASQRLSRSFGQMNLNIPTETVGAIYDIAKTYVEEYGIVKPQELIKRMRDDHAALKGISDADILESIATAGNPGRVAKTRSEAAQNLAQLRKEAAAAMGNPEKIKAINAKIADLEDQISTGNFKMPKARTKAAPGSELELAQIRLQESRARVNAAIRAREPKSAGQKVAGFLRETALANPIARLQDLNSNLWSAADNTTWSPIDRALANRISKSAGGEGVAGRVGWNKTRNERVFRNYGASIKSEMAGSNSKFLSDGHYLKPSTWAGATDAPFRVAYERGAWSDLADSFAKRTGKDSESAFRQLVNEEYTPGPMNHADWKAGREAGTKIADRLTYNNENAASALSSKVKEAIRHYQKHGTPSQQATAQYMEPAVDNILRFSKVIYNVAADRLQRSGQGVVKGASRHIRGIRAAEAMTAEEAMHIARLYRKGATGALTTYAAYLYAKYQMPDGQTGSQHFPGELVKTKSGKVYVDFGSFEQISAFAPILFGVGIARLEKLPTHNGKTDSGGEGVTESQKKDAWLNMLTDLVTNQPLFSGPERIIKATQSESGMKGYAASVALGAIPGAAAIRGIANLVDESKGIRYRSAQTPMDKAKLLLPWWMRDEVAPAENKLPERLRK